MKPYIELVEEAFPLPGARWQWRFNTDGTFELLLKVKRENETQTYTITHGLKLPAV